MQKKKVLFLCVHNSARSQIAEETLRRLAGDEFEAESAGLTPGELNPYVVEVLGEDGIDISGKETTDAFELLKEGRYYSYVITLCDELTAETCPIYPGCIDRFHWSFPDPSKFTGSDEEIKEQVREVKKQIESKLSEWIVKTKVEKPEKRLSLV